MSAYSDGLEAAVRVGGTPFDNPHRVESLEFKEWQDGWRYGAMVKSRKYHKLFRRGFLDKKDGIERLRMEFDNESDYMSWKAGWDYGMVKVMV